MLASDRRPAATRALLGQVGALVAILGVLAGGAWFIAQQAIDHLLVTDAVASGYNWASYLAVNVPDLDQIASGKAPSAFSSDFFKRAQQVGHVFRYKIFDPRGRLRLSSDQAAGTGADERDLAEHNVEAARAIARGQPLVEVGEGQSPTEPAFFAEAYVPVQMQGKTIAILEVYVDQTDKRQEFRNAVVTAGLSLSLLTAVAFGIPAIAWYRRTREKLRVDAEIDFLARHDAMTGLANRYQVTEQLRQRLATSDILAVHYVDIDRFKDVNDLFGHDSGDALIKCVAERLRSLVGEKDLVARLGADEFAVLQTEIRGTADASALAQRLCERLAAPYTLNGREIVVTVSVGVATAPEHGDDALTLMRGADLALHKSKAEGRSCARFFSHDLNAELQARLRLERTIREATANDGFELYFQPLFGTADNDLRGFEALLRLRAEDGSFISPVDFIPVAEQIGLIDRIGAWVLRNACTVAAAWPEHLTIAVNLSPAQFSGDSVCELAGRTLAQTGLAAERLELEITESLLMGDSGRVRRELACLKALGIAVVMDDFGTGYSSLGYLWRFPFDKIKIDRSFMHAFDAADRNAETVIRTIVGLGHSLNMRVTVEGVETARQAAFLRDVACDEMQGFFFARPMPAIDVAACIAADIKARARVRRRKPEPSRRRRGAPKRAAR